MKAGLPFTGVSTHSRPKAAAKPPTTITTKMWFQHTAARRRLPDFNRQFDPITKFQHTAARRRLRTPRPPKRFADSVSTHSRPKAAAWVMRAVTNIRVRFNTQPPEGGCIYSVIGVAVEYSFNTQPPEGGCSTGGINAIPKSSFNTQPPEGGCRSSIPTAFAALLFQHTAARRRLRPNVIGISENLAVSTHSRPKAAASHSTKK